MRALLVILASVAAGVLVRGFVRQYSGDGAGAEVNSTLDAAVGLREISAATQPSKLWAVDFASYASTHPGRWVVGHCAEPCLSEAEAGKEARADAAKVVWPMVAGPLGLTPGEASWLRERVVADVVAGRFDADTLAERFERPYGTVWTDSVLMDVSAGRVDAVVNSYRDELSDWRNRQAIARRGVALGMVGAWLAYLFLNAVTKGYFTTRLRLAAGVLTAVGVALLV
jgi:hypothetical protein